MSVHTGVKFGLSSSSSSSGLIGALLAEDYSYGECFGHARSGKSASNVQYVQCIYVQFFCAYHFSLDLEI